MPPMGLRFYRRVRLFPGVSVNLSRSGPSLTISVRGAHITVGSRGVTKTIGVPGSGLFHTSRRSSPDTLRKSKQVLARTGLEDADVEQ